VLECVIVFALAYLLVAIVLTHLLPKHTYRRIGIATIVFGLAALALSAVGNDYRRWWSLAFIALLGAIVILNSPRPSARRKYPPTTLALIGLTLIVSVAVGYMPIWPDFDPKADTAFSIERIHALDPTWR
jgi:O-antigen ligase